MVKTFRWSWTLVLQFQSCSRRRGEDGPQKSQIKLKTYTGEALEIIGQVQVEVTYQDQLNELLKDGVELKWSTDQQKSLNQLKDKFSSTSVLTYLTRSYR